MSRGRVVVVLLVLGALAFALSVLPWVSAQVPTVLAERTITVSGGGAAPATTAAALAVLATALAVALGGRWVLRLCALAVAGLGALLAASAVGVVLDPLPPVLTAAAAAAGVRDITGDPSLTVWPYLTAGLGLLVAAAAVLVLRVPTTTAPPGRRFERGPLPAAPSQGGTAPPAPADATVTDTSAADPGPPGGEAPTARDERVRAMDDWDALGRGEDPSAPEHR